MGFFTPTKQTEEAGAVDPDEDPGTGGVIAEIGESNEHSADEPEVADPFDTLATEN